MAVASKHSEAEELLARKFQATSYFFPLQIYVRDRITHKHTKCCKKSSHLSVDLPFCAFHEEIRAGDLKNSCVKRNSTTQTFRGSVVLAGDIRFFTYNREHAHT